MMSFRLIRFTFHDGGRQLISLLSCSVRENGEVRRTSRKHEYRHPEGHLSFGLDIFGTFGPAIDIFWV
jgi:hypothetical protein